MCPTLSSGADLVALARWYATHTVAWPLAPRFDPVRRWYARLAQTDDHEVWLLTWLPGQATVLHDHGGSAGAFVIVSGVLTECTIVTASARGAAQRVDRRLPAGAARAFGPHHVHRIANTDDRPAVSIHVYVPALSTMTRYDLEGTTLYEVAVERAGEAW
jgi:predicted metal-dependent enzyme (double-stranded beta helix superfamily)